MCTGVPVLRTRTSGTTETIIENITGQSCDIDQKAFVAAAINFLKDPAALRKMGESAAGHVRQNLTFEKQFLRTVELYQSLLH